MVAQVVREEVQVFEERVQRMRTKGSLVRDTLVFFAGAEACHTLAHVWLGLSGMLPMEVPLFPSITVTQGLNIFAIVVNALITAGLLYGAKRLTR
jgi:hypothetical protein